MCRIRPSRAKSKGSATLPKGDDLKNTPLGTLPWRSVINLNILSQSRDSINSPRARTNATSICGKYLLSYDFASLRHYLTFLAFTMLPCETSLVKNLFMSSEADFLEKYRKLVPSKEWQAFKKHFKKPLRKSLRVNTLKVLVEEFEKVASKEDWQLSSVPWCSEGFFIDREDRSIPLGSTWQHLAGLFYIQEASSMLPVEKIKLKVKSEKMKILDLCSAPGSKLTQLAAKFPEALIVANEVDRKRVIALKQNITRQGLTNVVITSLDASKFAELTPNFFDIVLVDAPCSGEGMIRKSPKVLEFWSEKKVRYMAGIQKRITETAFVALSPGGQLIYSTCTYAPEENEEVLKYLVEKEKVVKIEEQERIWPQMYDTEGFFVARIRKNSDITDPPGHPPTLATTIADKYEEKVKRICKKRRTISKTQSQHTVLAKKQSLQTNSLLKKNWGIDLSKHLEKYSLLKQDNKIHLVPKAALRLPLKYIQTGIELGSLIRNELILSHAAAIALGKDAQKNVLELSQQQATSNQQSLISNFLSGQDLPITLKTQETKQLIVCYEGYPLGLVKIVGEKLKNQLPREYRTNN